MKCKVLGEYRKGMKVDKEMKFLELVQDIDVYGMRGAWYGVFVRKAMKRIMRRWTQRVARAFVLIAGHHWRSVRLGTNHFMSAQSFVTTSSSLSFTKTTCNDLRAGINVMT